MSVALLIVLMMIVAWAIIILIIGGIGGIAYLIIGSVANKIKNKLNVNKR